MKKSITILLIALFMGSISMTSCNKGAYCPANETLHTKTKKDGKLSTKRGKSSLFPKGFKQ